MQYRSQKQSQKALQGLLMYGRTIPVFLYGSCMPGFGNLIPMVFLTGPIPQWTWTKIRMVCENSTVIFFELLKRHQHENIFFAGNCVAHICKTYQCTKCIALLELNG